MINLDFLQALGKQAADYQDISPRGITYSPPASYGLDTLNDRVKPINNRLYSGGFSPAALRDLPATSGANAAIMSQFPTDLIQNEEGYAALHPEAYSKLKPAWNTFKRNYLIATNEKIKKLNAPTDVASYVKSPGYWNQVVKPKHVDKLLKTKAMEDDPDYQSWLYHPLKSSYRTLFTRGARKRLKDVENQIYKYNRDRQIVRENDPGYFKNMSGAIDNKWNDTMVNDIRNQAGIPTPSGDNPFAGLGNYLLPLILGSGGLGALIGSKNGLGGAIMGGIGTSATAYALSQLLSSGALNGLFGGSAQSST